MGTVLDCILCFLLCQHWSLIDSEEIRLTSGCDLCRVATESERCDTVTLLRGTVFMPRCACAQAKCTVVCVCVCVESYNC